MITLIILLGVLITGGYLLRDFLADMVDIPVKELTTKGGLIYYLFYPIILFSAGLIYGYTKLHELSNKLYTLMEDFFKK